MNPECKCECGRAIAKEHSRHNERIFSENLKTRRKLLTSILLTVSVVTRFFVLLLPPTDLLEISGSKDWTGVAGGMTVEGGMPFMCATDFEEDLADFDDGGNFELGGVFTLGETLEVAASAF